MTQQLSFADTEFTQKRRQTKKEKFLARMDKLIPWERLEKVIEPHYPKAGNGRRPYPLPVMLRIHCLQQWYNLSDPAMEDALYEISSMRLFAGLSLDNPIPDETTVMNFRHLLEKHHLSHRIFDEVKAWLIEAGAMLKEGTIVDATIINAPTSTKNKRKERDPDMHSTRKGNQWYFGMKAHIGVDVQAGLTHSFTTTAANQHDLNEAHNLLHGEEQYVFGDAGYQGAETREDLENCKAEWLIAERPGVLKKLKERPRKNRLAITLERSKASIRAKVEHPFRIIKRQFGFRKARYRGLPKNDSKLAMLLALANVYRVGQMLSAGG